MRKRKISEILMAIQHLCSEKKKKSTSPFNIIYRTGFKSPFPRMPLTLANCFVTVTRGSLCSLIASAVGGQVKRGDVCMHEADEKKWDEQSSKLWQSPDRFPTDRLRPSDSREKIKQKRISIPTLRDSPFYSFTGDTSFFLLVEALVKKAAVQYCVGHNVHLGFF